MLRFMRSLPSGPAWSIEWAATLTATRGISHQGLAAHGRGHVGQQVGARAGAASLRSERATRKVEAVELQFQSAFEPWL